MKMTVEYWEECFMQEFVNFLNLNKEEEHLSERLAIIKAEKLASIHLMETYKDKIKE